MKVVFKSVYASIRGFDEIELSDFTVLTGLNGSGKTHFLKAIQNGQSQIDDINRISVKYFDYKDFRVDQPEVQLAEKVLTQQKNQAWTYFGNTSRGQINWKNIATQIYNQCFVSSDDQENATDSFLTHFPQEKSIWTVKKKDVDQDLWSDIKNYREQIKDRIFRNPSFRSNQYFRGVAKTLMGSRKPLHLVPKTVFDSNFIPIKRNNNFIYESLGSLFSNYIRNRFRWLTERVSSENTISWAQASEDFDHTFPKPWIKINEIISRINQYSPDPTVFDFKIMEPSLSATIDNYKTLRVNPIIIDNETGEGRGFQTLSSGEQVLLALALTLYESTDSMTMPEVILLDEVDASLHPSMTIALIETIKSAFLENGIKVILATHSPSTVAFAPEGSIYVIEPIEDRRKSIRQTDHKDALEFLTEGFATLDNGVMLFDQVLSNEFTIISEGHNKLILDRYLSLIGISNVSVVGGIEGLTGGKNLNTIFQFFSQVPHNSKVLIVYDVDEGQKTHLKEKNSTFHFTLNRHPDNSVCGERGKWKGVEACFPDSSFPAEMLKTIIDNGTNEKVSVFNFERHKKNFADHILENSDLDDFSGFENFRTKIQEIFRQ